jgi:dTDP-4-dehydrorhamnose reductase
VESKKTILIFGLSSFLGSNIAANLKSEYRIVGTYNETPVNISGVLSIKCNVNNKDMVQKVVLLFKPDITVYAVGLTDMDACQEFPKVADALNTAGVFNVSMASERYHSKFVYFSSAYIFSGEDILCGASDTPVPSSVYGNTIASAEFYIQKSCLNYIIFRCSPIFGRSYNQNDLKWCEAIERSEFLGQKIVCDTKVHTGFVDIHTVTDYLKKAIENNVTNKLLHVTTRDIMSRFDFAKLYLEIFGGNQALLVKGNWKFPQTENQIALQSLSDELRFHLDATNLEAEFQLKIPSIREMILSYKTKLEGSFSAKKIASAGITFI